MASPGSEAMYQPNQRVTVDLSSLMIKGVFFSQNVQKAIGTIVQIALGGAGPVNMLGSHCLPTRAPG
jgi:hypothetical protein